MAKLGNGCHKCDHLECGFDFLLLENPKFSALVNLVSPDLCFNSLFFAKFTGLKCELSDLDWTEGDVRR